MWSIYLCDVSCDVDYFQSVLRFDHDQQLQACRNVLFPIKIAIPEASEPLTNCTFSYGTISIDDINLFCCLCSIFSFPEIKEH